MPANACERIQEQAASWKHKLTDVTLPWLCWSIDDEWSLAQQKLVAAAGWTPLVGTDGSISAPKLIDGAIHIDFAGDIGVRKMRPHFVIEFAHLFTSRLAYWHSDVLLPLPMMHQFAETFEHLPSGKHTGIVESPTLGMMWERFRKKQPLFWSRIFEVLGCITAEASQSQWDTGLGLWRHIRYHPNASPSIRSKPPYYEFGVGWRKWAQSQHQGFIPIQDDIERYHYTQINNAKYISVVDPRDNRRFKGVELRENYDVHAICKQLGIDHL